MAVFFDVSPFLADGCSGGVSTAWRIFSKHDPPWEGCCFQHDRDYRNPQITRREADRKLLVCVASNGHPGWAILMWAAVRLFGGAFFLKIKDK